MPLFGPSYNRPSFAEMYIMGKEHIGSQSPLSDSLAEAHRSCFLCLSRCWGGDDPQSVEITTTWGTGPFESWFFFSHTRVPRATRCRHHHQQSAMAWLLLWPAVSPCRHGAWNETTASLAPEVSPIQQCGLSSCFRGTSAPTRALLFFSPPFGSSFYSNFFLKIRLAFFMNGFIHSSKGSRR